MREWIIRAVVALCLLVPMAFAAKHYLIVPYSVNVFNFDVYFDDDQWRAKKGDKEIWRQLFRS